MLKGTGLSMQGSRDFCSISRKNRVKCGKDVSHKRRLSLAGDIVPSPKPGGGGGGVHSGFSELIVRLRHKLASARRQSGHISEFRFLENA